MGVGFCRQIGKVLGVVLLGMTITAIGAAEEHPQTQPATATTKPAIPLVYASKDGKPFPNFPPQELARIIGRAGEMTPPSKEIWFILVRSGTWFPAAEVYCTPDKVHGRVCSGQYAMIWRKDSEKAITKLSGGIRWEDYVSVVEPNTPVPKVGAGHAPPVPKTHWLPFRRPCNDDKLIVSLADTVQEYRQHDKDRDHPDPSMPIMEIQRDGSNYNVLVAWPDQGYEDFCIVKPTDKGFEAVGWSFVAH